MKILLLYFTGTYNTLYLTTIIKNTLMNKGHSVDAFLFTDKNKIKVNNYDFVGIGYPIHAYNSPKIVEDKLKELKITNKKYFIYKNGGEPHPNNKASSYQIYKIMKKNRNELMGEYEFVMPCNFQVRTSDSQIRYELEYNHKYVKYMCDNLENKKEYKVPLLKRFYSSVLRLSRIGFKSNSKSYFVDKEKCIKCRECINNCPSKNIEYSREEKKIIFKDKCLSCMRCSFICPTNAINIGMLEKSKINGKYDFLSINLLENTFDLSTLSKKEYKHFKAYYDYIDSLIK